MSISILNGIQSREFNRAQAMQILFDENSKTYILSPSFNAEVQLFYNNNNQLQTYIPIKKENGKGITKDKATLKSEVAEAAAFVCNMTTAYAIKIDNNDLKNSVAYTEAVIGDMKDGDILGFVNSIIAVVTPLLSKGDFSTSYSITAETLSDLSSLATDFNGSIGKAALVDTNSGIASRNIDEVLAAIRSNIVQFDLLIAFFKKKYPDFVDAYRKAIIIHDTGIHHSGIKGTIINATTEVAVKEVSVTLQGLTGKKYKKATLSGEDGKYEIIKFAPGKCRLTITALGYESQVIDITIIRGKTIELNISLQSAVIEFNKTA